MIISGHYIDDAGIITCGRHLPEDVKAVMDRMPRALTSPDGQYARMYQHELERYLDAGVRCTGCSEEMERNRIALAEHLSRR